MEMELNLNTEFDFPFVRVAEFCIKTDVCIHNASPKRLWVAVKLLKDHFYPVAKNSIFIYTSLFLCPFRGHTLSTRGGHLDPLP